MARPIHGWNSGKFSGATSDPRMKFGSTTPWSRTSRERATARTGPIGSTGMHLLRDGEIVEVHSILAVVLTASSRLERDFSDGELGQRCVS